MSTDVEAAVDKTKYNSYRSFTVKKKQQKRFEMGRRDYERIHVKQEKLWGSNLEPGGAPLCPLAAL